MKEKGSLSEKDKLIVPRQEVELERLDAQRKKLQTEVIDLIKDDHEGATEQKDCSTCMRSMKILCTIFKGVSK